MALIDLADRRVHGKIAYYGPGLGGKTTNLRYIQRMAPPETRGELRAIAAETERTLFCDVLRLELGSVLGFALRYDLYTVPGQDRYERTRQAVLHGADGVVFVADAQERRLDENLRSLEELTANVTLQGKRLSEFPLVLQFNKMDLPDALPTPALDRALNAVGAPRFEASAANGAGVFETLRAICKAVTRSL